MFLDPNEYGLLCIDVDHAVNLFGQHVETQMDNAVNELIRQRQDGKGKRPVTPEEQQAKRNEVFSEIVRRKKTRTYISPTTGKPFEYEENLD